MQPVTRPGRSRPRGGVFGLGPRTCEYCNEPFTPTPGPMAAKQRFCCTKHRIYASRSQGAPTTPTDARGMPTAPDAFATTAEFERRVKAEVKKRADQYRAECDANVAAYKAKLSAENEKIRAACDKERAEYHAGVEARRAKGLITPDEFNLIRSCLHPDSRASASDEKLAQAFRVFNGPRIKALLVKSTKTKRA